MWRDSRSARNAVEVSQGDLVTWLVRDKSAIEVLRCIETITRGVSWGREYQEDHGNRRFNNSMFS